MITNLSVGKGLETQYLLFSSSWILNEAQSIIIPHIFIIAIIIPQKVFYLSHAKQENNIIYIRRIRAYFFSSPYRYGNLNKPHHHYYIYKVKLCSMDSNEVVEKINLKLSYIIIQNKLLFSKIKVNQNMLNSNVSRENIIISTWYLARWSFCQEIHSSLKTYYQMMQIFSCMSKTWEILKRWTWKYPNIYTSLLIHLLLN